MSKNSRNFPKKADENLKETITKLKAQLRKVQKRHDKLAEDYKSLEAAWRKTEDFLKASVEDIPIADLLKHNKLPKKAMRKKKPTSEQEDDKKRAINNALDFLKDKKGNQE